MFCPTEKKCAQTIMVYVCLLTTKGVLSQISLPPAQRCVLPGTCSENSSGPSIDLRIVLPSNPVRPTIPTCPPGLVPCRGSVVPKCGVQYVENCSTLNGVSTPGAFPWQVYISNQTGFTGSGVLLDDIHVLTAAHKVVSCDQVVSCKPLNPLNITVRLGVFDPRVTTGNIFRAAVNIIPHPLYNCCILANDIAIVRLDAPVPLGVLPTINPICLPPQGASFVGRSCLVSGWGQSEFTKYDSPVSTQKQVLVLIVPFDTCRNNLTVVLPAHEVDKHLTEPGNLCAGGEDSKDACINDGGGPLMCRDGSGKYLVVGLVLWGKGCGLAGVPGVYANVANYRGWIDSVIGPGTSAQAPPLVPI